MNVHNEHVSRQSGVALLFIIVTLVTLGLLVAGISQVYAPSETSNAFTNANQRSAYAAEAAYRVLATQYRDAADEMAKTVVLGNLDGQTINVGDDTAVMTIDSYFLRVSTDPNGTTSLVATTAPNLPSGVTVPLSGIVGVGGQNFEYTSRSVVNDTTTFNMASALPSIEVNRIVRFGVKGTTTSVASEGGTLVLTGTNSDLSIFPESNGQITIDSNIYTYDNRVGTVFNNVSAAEGTTFSPISAASNVQIIANPFLTVTSLGRSGSIGETTRSYLTPISDTLVFEPDEGVTTPFADTGDLVPSASGLGIFEVTDVDGDGNDELKTTGERLIDEGVTVENVFDSVETLADTVITELESRRDSAPFLQKILISIEIAVWEGIKFLSQLAESLAGLFGVLDDEIDVPAEVGYPKTFIVFDWAQLGLDMDGFHANNSNTLSYDIQTKIGVIPNTSHYMAGISFRLDDSIENGGNMLGVSIQRGNSDDDDQIPESLVPLKRTGTESPLVVLWAQKDLDGDGTITPGWTVNSFSTGSIQIWPEERQWLAYAELRDSYNLSNNANIDDWVNLTVRVAEKVENSNQFNEISVYMTGLTDSDGGGAIIANDYDLVLDKKRNGYPKIDYNQTISSQVKWPLYDVQNKLTSEKDNFSLFGGTAVKLQMPWVVNPAANIFGFTVTVEDGGDGASTLQDLRRAAILKVTGFTTGEGYTVPEEVGFHTFGDNLGEVYFDDFSLRLETVDEATSTPGFGDSGGFISPISN